MRLVSREHEFCYGHRVAGHENKCANLHGHNGKVKFSVEELNNKLDNVGRVADFSVLKDKLCDWLEKNWDHKMLLWEKDPFISALLRVSNCFPNSESVFGIIRVPFNPTAEEMAGYLLHVVGPELFKGTSLRLVSVEFFETSKCSVFVGLD